MDRQRLGPLFAIVLGVALALAWAVVSPIFAEPDEEVHLDYALSLAHRGWPLGARPFAYHTDEDPLLRRLEDVLHYREMRFDTSYRAPDQNSPTLRRVLSTGVPASGGNRDGPLPLIAISYPAGYYFVAAQAYKAERSLFHLDRVDSVKALRLLGILALAITLAAAERCFRLLAFSRTQALLGTLVIAIFPLSSWVSATVQPDTFTTALVTLALYSSLIVRDRPDSTHGYVYFSATCVGLACVKAHYAAFTFFGLLPVVLSGIVRKGTRTRIAGTFASTVVVGAAVFASVLSLPRTPGNPHHLALGALLHTSDWLQDVVETYVDGPTHDSFWLSRDWAGTTFFPAPAIGIVRACLSVASIVVALLVLLTVCSAARRLPRIARRHPRVALALVLRDAAFWLYAAWTVALVASDVSLGHFGLLGRYWLPVVVPLLALASRSVSYSARPGVRPRLRTAFLSGWVAYAAIAAPFAFWQMEHRFYGPAEARSTLDRYIDIERIYDSNGTTFSSNPIDLAPGGSLCLRGLAIDSRFGLPAKGMLMHVGSVDYPLTYGLPRRGNPYHDDALTNIGFAGCIAGRRLGAGRHEGRLIVLAQDASRLRWPRDFEIVVPAARGR